MVISGTIKEFMILKRLNSLEKLLKSKINKYFALQKLLFISLLYINKIHTIQLE